MEMHSKLPRGYESIAKLLVEKGADVDSGEDAMYMHSR